MFDVFYQALFVLSLVLIHPLGQSRGYIWTIPKVAIVFVLLALNGILLWQSRHSLKLTRSWKIAALLWGCFLGVACFATLYSPFPLRSLFGQDQMGDGLLYWMLIAGFMLTNNLVLQQFPELVRSQLQGLVIGGSIVALSIFPQILNWKIDYTITSGHLLQPNVLASTIFQNQQPIGLYSHRGHASIVLAMTGILTLASWHWQWIKARWGLTALGLIVPALLFTQTRAGIVAFVVGVAYLLGRKHYRFLGMIALVAVLLVTIFTTTRQIAGSTTLWRQVTSDRAHLWELSLRGIAKRPHLGWGFDGFGSAYPYIRVLGHTPKNVQLGQSSFIYQGHKSGKFYKLPLITVKAHNLIFDLLLSVGWIGTLPYLLLIGFAIWQLTLSPYRGIEGVAIAYLFFTLTWFEAAQFAHIFWWSLSLFTADGKPGITRSGL